MSAGDDKLNPADRQEAISDLDEFLRGTKKNGSVIEGYSNLQFPEVKEDAETALSKATHRTRTETFFKLSLYRSLRYSVASGVYCHTAGHLQARRRLYEGQRLAYPLGLDT